MPSPEPGAAPDAEVLRQAAEWFAVVHADEVNDADLQRWREWLAAQPQHAQAWRRVELLSQRFTDLPASLDRPAASHALQSPLRRRETLAGVAALTVGGVFAAWSFGTDAGRGLRAEYRASVGEQRQVRLADGSQVWINTDSAFDAHFDGVARRVDLHMGEVLVQTAQDTAMPHRRFEVVVPQGRVEALGTRFAVRRVGERCRVAVFEGQVQLRCAADPAPRLLDAGRQLEFDELRVYAEQPADPARQAWTQGMLLADNLRMADFVAELARYQRGHLACSDALADLRVVGAFPVNDIPLIYATLEKALPVKVHQPLPWWTSIEAR